MDEALKERLIRYLDSVEGKVDKAIDFTAEQTPLYVQELCQYGAVNHATAIVIAAFAITSIMLAYVILFFMTRNIQDDEPRYMLRGFGLIPVAFVSLFAGGSIEKHVPELYKCVYCPRVYIVEQISNMVK